MKVNQEFNHDIHIVTTIETWDLMLYLTGDDIIKFTGNIYTVQSCKLFTIIWLIRDRSFSFIGKAWEDIQNFQYYFKAPPLKKKINSRPPSPFPTTLFKFQAPPPFFFSPSSQNFTLKIK